MCRPLREVDEATKLLASSVVVELPRRWSWSGVLGWCLLVMWAAANSSACGGRRANLVELSWAGDRERERKAVGREKMWRLGQNSLEGTNWSREGCSSRSTTVEASTRGSWSVGRHFLGGDQEVWGFGALWPCGHWLCRQAKPVYLGGKVGKIRSYLHGRWIVKLDWPQIL